MSNNSVHLGADGLWLDGPAQPTTAPASTTPQQGIRIGGSTRLDMSTGEVATSGPSKFQFGHDSGQAGGSVAATLRTSTGQPSVELIPGQPGSRTSVAVAMREGLIRLDPATGQYLDTRSFADPAPATEPQRGTDTATLQEHPQEAVEASQGFDAAEDAEWASAIEPMPQAAYDSAVARTITSVTLGTDPASVIEGLAQASGMTRERAAEFVEVGTNYFEDIAERAVTPILETPELRAAFRQALEQDRDGFARVLRSLTMGRDAGPLVAAAKAWKR